MSWPAKPGNNSSQAHPNSYPFPTVFRRGPISLTWEACHGESTTQGEGNQGKSREKQEKGRGKIRKTRDVR